MVFQTKQRVELFRVKLIDADAHVMRQHEIEEVPLLAVEVRADDGPRVAGPVLPGQRCDGIIALEMSGPPRKIYSRNRISMLLCFGRTFAPTPRGRARVIGSATHGRTRTSRER